MVLIRIVVSEGGRPNALHNRSKCPSLYQFPSSASLTDGCTFKQSKGVSPVLPLSSIWAFFETQQRRLQRRAFRSYRHVQQHIYIDCDSGMQRTLGRSVIRTVVSNAGFNFRSLSPCLHSRYSLSVATKEANPPNGLDHCKPLSF